MLDLLKIDLEAGDAGQAALDIARRVAGLCLWKACDEALVYAYAEAGGACASVSSLPGCHHVPLECVSDLSGAAAGLEAPCHYVVETDVEPHAARDLENWYAREHLPGLAAVPGTVRARRFMARNGTPRSYACYYLVSFDVLTSAPWLAVRATDWSSRVRPMFRNTRRTLFRRMS